MDFHLVEEAIIQNKDSIRLQEVVSQMIRSRAQAELMYVQQIENWKIEYENNLPKEVCDKVKDLIGLFKSSSSGSTSVDCLKDVHRKIYEKIMAENGPYQNILKLIRQEQGKRLAEIEDEFKFYNTQREDLQNSVNQHKEAIDNMKGLLVKIEEKISKRSRKRSTKSARKLDSLKTQMSDLQGHIKRTYTACTEDETELRSLISSKRNTLRRRYQELKELDKDRFKMIYNVISEFVKCINPPYDLICQITAQNLESLKNLRENDIRQMHDRKWKPTQERARLKTAGLVTGVDMFLVPSPFVQHQYVDLHVTEDGTSMDTTRQMVPQYPPLRGQQESPEKETRNYPPQNTISSFSHHDRVLKSNLIMKYPSPLVTEYSENEIETLELPPETYAPRPNPFTVKGFCVEEGETSEVVKDDPCRKSEEDYVVKNNDSGERQIIKVIAGLNYTAQSKQELNLKKGQLIKQILADHEKGFAFGYTRKNKFSKKRYGWYPINIVSCK